MEQLKVNGRYFYAGDKPFFWLGDTAWEIFHCCTREEMIMYLDVRKKQGFNVVQCVALAERDGIYKSNPYGDHPLKNEKLPEIVPDTDRGYWKNIDFFIDEAEKRGIYVALLPTWGDKFNIEYGKGPEILNGENSYKYGAWIGNRYKNRKNLVWILGGDRPLLIKRHFDVIYQMAEGIKSSGADQLMTFHPIGAHSSSAYFHAESWLDFHMFQSGHIQEFAPIEEMAEHDLALSPPKPVLDGEPCYEDHPINFKQTNGYTDAFDVRRRIYGSVFSGACGVTYGHHAVWCMNSEYSSYFPYTWKAALDRPAAWQVHHLKDLVLSLDFESLHPIKLSENEEGALTKSALSDGKSTIIYTPFGLPIVYELENTQSAQWFCTIDGTLTDAKKTDGKYFPPKLGRGHDYVLILKTE